MLAHFLLDDMQQFIESLGSKRLQEKMCQEKSDRVNKQVNKVKEG